MGTDKNRGYGTGLRWATTAGVRGQHRKGKKGTLWKQRGINWQGVKPWADTQHTL